MRRGPEGEDGTEDGTEDGGRGRRTRKGRGWRCCVVLLAVLGVVPALWVQAGGQERGNREISGTVLNGKTNHPLAEAEVVLTNPHNGSLVAATLTDEEGRFSFPGLPNGKFSLRATHRGFVGANFEEHAGGISTAIVTGEGLHSTNLRFPLAPQAVLFGTIAEDSGDPVPQAQVWLFRKDERNGSGKVVRASGAMADALGKFEFPSLRPGQYFLCASGTPWYAKHPQRQHQEAVDAGRVSLDVAYAITCAPGVNDPAAAEAIALVGGDRIQTDVTMHAVGAVHIPMQAPTRDGRFAGFPQLRQEVFGFAEMVPTTVNSSTWTSGDGRTTAVAEVTGFAPGHYEVEVSGREGEPSRTGSLEAGSALMTLDAVASMPMASVSGRVGSAAGEDKPAQLYVALVPKEGNAMQSAAVDKEGKFHMPTVRPGEYEVLVSAAGEAMTVTRLAAKAGSLRGHVLQVSSEPIEMNLTVARATAVVRGVVKRGGQPASGVFVALLPVNPEAGLEARQPNQSDSDGSFDFPNVPAGEYFLAAIEEGWTLDWARREAMAPYLARASRITVPAHAREVVAPEAIEAQAK